MTIDGSDLVGSLKQAALNVGMRKQLVRDARDTLAHREQMLASSIEVLEEVLRALRKAGELKVNR